MDLRSGTLTLRSATSLTAFWTSKPGSILDLNMALFQTLREGRIEQLIPSSVKVTKSNKVFL